MKLETQFEQVNKNKGKSEEKQTSESAKFFSEFQSLQRQIPSRRQYESPNTTLRQVLF